MNSTFLDGAGITTSEPAHLSNESSTLLYFHPYQWFYEQWNWFIWNVFVWLFPLMCGLGAIVNACAFSVIATNRKVFPYVTRQYMLIIIINDFLILTFKATDHYFSYMSNYVKDKAWTWYKNPEEISFLVCIVYDFLSYYALCGSQFFQLGLTVDRLVAVAVPIKAKQILSRKRSWALLAVITCMALFLPVLFVSNRAWVSEFQVCYYRDFNHYLNVYSSIEFYFGRVFLLSVLVIGTVAICLLLVRNSRTARRMQLEPGAGASRNRMRSDISMTLMLVYLSITFLVTALPWSAGLAFSVELYAQMEGAQYAIMMLHFDTLIYANSALRWPIYFLGRKFRTAFVRRFIRPCVGSPAGPSVSYRIRSEGAEQAPDQMEMA